MIFISYTHKDRRIIEPIATQLGSVFGTDQIFYDRWSIQPGDSLIDKMGKGLEGCRFFFFFVSKNSLQSELVKLEWQSAILKMTKGQTKLIPVKIDDCLMPDVLLQTMYIDYSGQGSEIAIRQMIDVIQGNNTFRPDRIQQFQNIRAYVSEKDDATIVEFRAQVYMEPHSNYLILLDNKKEELKWSAVSESLYLEEFKDEIILNNGRKFAALYMGRSIPTSPGFPFTVELKSKTNAKINFRGAMKAISKNRYNMIPVIMEGQSDAS